MDSALALTRQKLADDSADDFSVFMLGKLSRDGKESFAFFHRLLHQNRTSPELEESYYRAAQYYYALGNYALAISHFREYLRRYPRGEWKEPAHYWMGYSCLFYAGNNEGKEAYLDSGLTYFQGLLSKVSPDDYYYALGWEGSARIYAALKEAEKAESSLANALNNAPADQHSHLLLLAAQITGGMAGDKTYYHQIHSRYPHSLEANYLERTGKSAVSFTLQVGAFSQRLNAEKLFNSLKANGLDPRLLESGKKGEVLHLVRLGSFHERESAQEFLKKNLQPLGISAHIMPALEQGK